MKSILPAVWQVPQRFKERLGESAGKQRAMLADGHLLLILHEPPGPDDRERGARFFWRDAQGKWVSSAHGGGPQSLRKFLDEYSKRLDKLEERLDRAQTAQEFFDLLQAIAPVSRSARHLHETLQAAREMLPDDRDLISLRDLAIVIDRSSDLLYQDAKNGLDFVTARAAEEQSRRSYEMTVSAHRLNIMAAVFFPLATMAALFGMNIPHGLEESRIGAFWAVLLVGIMLGVGLAMWIVGSGRQQATRGTGKHSLPG